MLDIPNHFLNVPYSAECYPGAEGFSKLEKGANCQLFAYEIIRYYGGVIPDFRSSELWEDSEYTEFVNTYDLLDLLLFNSVDDSWGAHLGLYIGENKIMHLSREEGFAKIWSIDDFHNFDRYRIHIGAKRLKSTYKPESKGVRPCIPVK